MKRIAFLLTSLVLLSLVSFAQKDAPVTGHAAMLIDFLKKDYNAIDPSARDEEISRDRTAVISIFKSYLTDDQKKDLKTMASSVELILNNKHKLYNELKEKFDLYSKQDDKKDLELKNLEKIFDALKNAKDTYSISKFNADQEELTALSVQYNDNGLLLPVVKQFRDKYKTLNAQELDAFASSNASSSIQKGIPFIGGALNFETFIDGLSRFLAKRIKEELTTYVIDRVKKWLQNPSENDPLAELKVLLPRTTGYLISFQANQVTNFVSEIKQYIEDDLNKVLTNAAQLRNTPRIRRLISNNPDIDFAFEALELIPSLAKIKHPVDYFTFLENSRNISRWRSETNAVKFNIASAIGLTGLLSRSLLIIDNGESRFAGVDFITTYAAESNFFRLYGGFLYQQNEKYYDIRFKRTNGALFGKLFDKIIKITDHTEFEETKNFFKNLLTDATKNAEKIFNMATDIRKANKAGQKIGADTVYNFVESIIGFSEEIAVGADALVLRLNEARLAESPLDKIKPYFAIAHATNEIVFDLRRKKYSTALIKTIGISAQLLNSNRFSTITSVVTGLSLVKENGDLNKWHALIKFAHDNDNAAGRANNTIPIDAAVHKAAAFAIDQLMKIELFNRINYTKSETTINTLQELKALCKGKLQGTTIAGKDLALVMDFFKENQYRNLLISYYAGIALDAATEKIQKEMTEMKVMNADKEINVFSPEEAGALVRLIENFAEELYLNYLNDGQTSEDVSLIKIREDITGYFKNYIAVLPQKFDIQVNPNVLLLIHLVNDLATAQSAEDVEKAIDAFALPSGSYSIKRKAKNNFAVNSYPGILPAYEYSSKPGGGTSSFSVGFTAPVGLSYTRGNKDGSSWAVFVPILDVAAITRLRLDDSKTTQALPTFNFKNIVSPGLYFSYGFKKSPFSINLGAQYGPELKEILSDGTTNSYESFRFGVGFVLDIPLFNLHTKPR